VIAGMILAAGLGTRMRPLSEWRAKPLAPVGDAPAIAHVLAALRRAGAGRVVVNAHHRRSDVRAFARSIEGLEVSEEAEILGTAGGVRRAAELLGDGDVLVWNGDILCADLDGARLVASHRAEATLAVRLLPRGEGNVGIAEDGRVVRLRRETTGAGEARGGEFLGVHVVSARLRAVLPERGCLVGDVYLPALRAGARVEAFVTEAEFHDIGTPASYLAANLAWLGARASFVAEGARVAPGVHLTRAIIGRGATVLADVEDAVVWDGACVEAKVARAIVAREGIVPTAP
jgi:mannose-1-phosphate guanylyltransferase